MSNMPRGTFMQVMGKYTKSLKAFISAQGFGHYSKPSGGIPKTDLEQSVQNSLEKADTALQSFSETDPTVPSWAKASSKPSYTQDEVGDGSTYKRVTATEKNAWNNKGTYSKPSGGIPKTDLASAVQTSLGKADSALQSFTETDPTVPSWAKQSSKPSYTYSEVGAAPASHNHSQLITAGDNRKVSTKPNDYSNVMRFQGIKEKSVIGNPSSDSYSYLVGLRGWSDDSGGNAHEFAFNNTGIFTRSGATTSWGSWSKLAMTSDIPSSLPASDVYSWAKQSSKPSYTQDEVSDGSTYKRVTSTEKSTWNSKYSKPSGGIPKTDLASAVQTSLGLADKSLPHTTVSGSPDLDTYLTTGVYHITTQTATHAPTTNHATLFVDGTVGTPYQIFKPDTTDTLWYTRHRSGSAWTSWVAMKFTDTTYSAATTSANGLMSSGDKTIVNKLSSTYTALTPGSSKISISHGGYIKIGKLCIINVLFTPSSDLSTYNDLLTGAPRPGVSVYVPMIAPYANDPISLAVIDDDGNIKNMRMMKGNETCYITAVYMAQ